MGSVSETWGSYSFLFGPAVAVAVLAVIIVLLRWAFPSRRKASGATGPTQARAAGPERAPEIVDEDFGLLLCAATLPTVVEAELVRLALADRGVRSGMTSTPTGTKVLVFNTDLAKAKTILHGSADDSS